jgi:hypothetical protein
MFTLIADNLHYYYTLHQEEIEGINFLVLFVAS